MVEEQQRFENLLHRISKRTLITIKIQTSVAQRLPVSETMATFRSITFNLTL